jgi:hypothetical protein
MYEELVIQITALAMIINIYVKCGDIFEKVRYFTQRTKHKVTKNTALLEKI